MSLAHALLPAHLHRVDGGVVTHLSAAVPDSDRARLDRELVPLLLAFRG